MKHPNHLLLRQWVTLLDAGIPILQTCHMLSLSLTDAAHKMLFMQLHRCLSKGLSLTTSFAQIKHPFAPITLALIHIGEQTGTLNTLLMMLADYQEKTSQFQQRIRSALYYPAWVSALALLFMLGLFIFIVPRFALLYQESHAELPALTRWILHTSQRFSHHLGLLTLVLTSLALSLRYVPLPQRYDHVRLHIPLVSRLLLTRFIRTFACLFHAGIPLNDTLPLLQCLSPNRHYQLILLRLHADITSGMPLYQAMHWHTFFPRPFISMIETGETSGKLATVLMKAALMYEEELDFTLNRLAQRLEPLIILILGVLIGVLVLALYLPIFKLGTVI